MADSDFERVCEAYWNEISGGACWSLHGERIRDPDREFIRRGMAAALREMRRTISGRGAEGDAQRAMIDALLAQAEDREAAQ